MIKLFIQKVKPKRCAHCGKAFEHHNPRAKFCSVECRGKAWDKRTGVKRDSYDYERLNPEP